MGEFYIVFTQTHAKIGLATMWNLIEYSHYMNPTQALPRRRLLLPAQFGGKRKRRVWLEPHICRHPLPYMVTFHFYHVLFQYLVDNSEICMC